MTDTIRRGHRGAAAAVLLLGGIAVALATWTSGEYGWAIAALVIYAALAGGAFVWAGRRTDVGALLRVDGDERQRGLDRDATAITGLVLSLAAVIGALIQIGRTGNPGVYGLFCIIAGAAYTVSVLVLRRRR
jgi:uncharacterized iron-regulated membrane protein